MCQPAGEGAGFAGGAISSNGAKYQGSLMNTFARVRQNLIEYAAEHTLDELLSEAVNEVCSVLNSPIGFYHFVESDQKTLSIQQFSTRALSEFCRTLGKVHYSIDRAGVWVDCVRERKPVIHNDYDSLKHKKGMPKGHVKVIRELVAPVMREGKIVAILGVGNKPENYTGKDIETVSYFADVTWEIIERKRAEETLRGSERKFRLAFQTSPDSITLSRISDGIFIDTNDGFSKISGYTREDAIGKTSLELGIWHNPVDRKCMVSGIRNSGIVENLEAKFRGKDGRIIIGLMSARVLHVDSEEVVLTITRDITERKRAEEALRDSELRLRSILQTANEGFWFIDNDVVTVELNPRMCAILGRDRKDVLGRKIFDFVDDENRVIFEQQVSLRAHGKSGSYEIALSRPDGSKAFCRFNATPFFDESGNRVGSFAMVIDISEHKLWENALRESEERFSLAMEATKDGLWDWDLKTNKVYYSPGYARMLGDLSGDVVSNVDYWMDRIHPEDKDAALKANMDCIENRRDDFEVEFRMRTVNGEWRWILGRGKAVDRDGNGRAIRMVGTHTDITERKYSEMALRESELKYRLNESRLEAILRLDRMTDATLHEITVFAMEEAVRLTQSSIGYVALMNENETVLSMSAFSRTAMQECRIDDKPVEYFVEETGLWGEAVRQRRPIITNDYQAPNPLKKGVPEGHVQILRHMNVPIFEGDRIVLVAGVGNKATNYDESDVRQLTLLMTGLWRIIQRRRSEEALRESEEKFFLAFKHAPVPTTITEVENGTYLDVNDKCLETVGYTRDELLGGTPVEMGILRAEDRRRLIEVLQRQGKVSGMEIIAYAKDGSPIHCLCHCEMVTIGGVKRLLTMAMDITERKKAEEERIRLATAIEQAEEAIFITAPDWTIEYVNPAFERMTGYNHGEIIGRHTHILRSYQHDDAFYKNMRDSLARAGVWSGRIINKKKDGTFYEAEATISPVRGKSGAIKNHVSIHRDITREVKLEAELHQARKMEAIGLLAGGIAHDFNNILAAIMGFTELSLFKISEDSPVRNYLEQVFKASTRASEVVKQILTFTRQRGNERKRIGIVAIIQDTLKLLRSSLPSTIEICEEIALKPGEDVVLADPGQINEVLMNLGTNAAHAMRAKGGTLTVKLSSVADVSRLSAHPGLNGGRYLCLAVSDTGHGMDSTVLERIFDPYFTTKGTGEGTGLGLSVVHGIVNAHGGAITVQSEPGQGATFSVFLPGLEDAKADDAKASEAAPTGQERILFVDDEEALVELGKQILETLGYRVTALTSSLEALEAFRAQPDAFDLVITDMTMPSLTGRELTEKIIALRSDTPIILSTGFPDLVNEDQGNEAGVREFVMKPYEIRTLADAVRRALEHK